MAGRTSTKTATIRDEDIPADAFRAYADFISAGPVQFLSFNDWFASDGGKEALANFQSANAAKELAGRKAAAKAVWRDLNVNGSIHTVAGKKASVILLDILKNADLEIHEDDPKNPPARKRSKGTAAADPDSPDADDAE